MSEKSEALRLAELLEKMPLGECDNQAAAELRFLHAENEELRRERDEARRTVREAHEAGTRLTAQRDALFEVLKSALRHAEWRDKIIYPSGGEEFQNWMISIYLPVPLSASDKSPETALDRFVAADIKAVEERK